MNREKLHNELISKIDKINDLRKLEQKDKVNRLLRLNQVNHDILMLLTLKIWYKLH